MDTPPGAILKRSQTLDKLLIMQFFLIRATRFTKETISKDYRYL